MPKTFSMGGFIPISSAITVLSDSINVFTRRRHLGLDAGLALKKRVSVKASEIGARHAFSAAGIFTISAIMSIIGRSTSKVLGAH